MIPEEITELIRRMSNERPLAEPRDLVKLLYQREFGPAHAIPDPKKAEEFLFEEYSRTPQEPGPLTGSIGNGYARLYLSRLEANGMTPSEAARLFVLSASPAGDKAGFAGLLEELKKDEEAVSLFPGLPGFVEEYVAAGCPAISHSEAYRAAYRPAYRVVKEELLRPSRPEII